VAIANSMLDVIGNTPLVRLNRTDNGEAREILAKIERFNPLGSIKDRTALAMVQTAERQGLLKQGSTLVEPTSGNTGIALAMIGAIRGYRVLLAMPDSMSIERQALLKALGAEVILTPGAEGMDGAIAESQRLAACIPNALILGQFDNQANPDIHEQTTGPEIWNDTDGAVDIVVAGIGTGGTLTGLARSLKRRKPAVRVVGVEPAGSPWLSEGRQGMHAIEGIGAGFQPSILDLSQVDEVVAVSDQQAAHWTRHLARHEGIFVGISSGAALAAATALAKQPASNDATIVVIFADGGEKYLSNPLWEVDDVPTNS